MPLQKTRSAPALGLTDRMNLSLSLSLALSLSLSLSLSPSRDISQEVMLHLFIIRSVLRETRVSLGLLSIDYFIVSIVRGARSRRDSIYKDVPQVNPMRTRV